MSLEDKLANAQKTKKSIKTTRGEVMHYLGFKRKGPYVEECIRNLIKKYDLIAEPKFETTWKWGEITLRPIPKVGINQSAKIEDDPTVRISILKEANLKEIKEKGQGEGLITVNKDTSIETAITLMMAHDFSQLPILGGTRKVYGIVSWRSIGKSLGLNKNCKTVMDCKEDVEILKSSTPLFKAVRIILDKEVVLVKQSDETISGIITSTDIGELFLSLAEPFLVVEQIENHIRKMLEFKFTIEEVRGARNPNDDSRPVNYLSNLSFGEYIRLVEKPENFEKLKLNIDRKLLVKRLNKIKDLRNDIMHFDPEGILEEDMLLLSKTLKWFQDLNNVINK